MAPAGPAGADPLLLLLVLEVVVVLGQEHGAGFVRSF